MASPNRKRLAAQRAARIGQPRLNVNERVACETVERLARSIGADCQIIFTKEGVEIAPLSDPGSTFATTLAKAISEALPTK